MTRKTLATIGILITLLAGLFGTAAAQDGGPTATPTPDPLAKTSETSSKFLTHPVVQLLSTYFSLNSETEDPVDPAAPTADETVTPEPTQTPQEALAEEIATYHEEGLGFGVLVKLYAMAEASKEACQTVTPPTGDTNTDTTTAADAETCTPVTVDELVTKFQSGEGMGQLFKENGKPALLGVGHVKKALKAQQEQQDDTTTTTTTNDTTQTGKGHKPPKTDKAGKGPKK